MCQLPLPTAPTLTSLPRSTLVLPKRRPCGQDKIVSHFAYGAVATRCASHQLIEASLVSPATLLEEN